MRMEFLMRVEFLVRFTRVEFHMRLKFLRWGRNYFFNEILDQREIDAQDHVGSCETRTLFCPAVFSVASEFYRSTLSMHVLAFLRTTEVAEFHTSPSLALYL